ncbi:hypothetical protein T11_1949 [Trichinella zimbabwensis]|uniref:PiggyBac transposable element-derived protein domain-containing protein n=1 Tax=Trichinella zimbabwensis TaxID=268475 RepID=A0A0V1GTR4_9BILA|nr:hypothetical protein T11_1949 [Trichinella zimbabwensis]
MEYGSFSGSWNILVVKGQRCSLLGRNWFEPLGIHYAKLFSGTLGTVKGPPVVLHTYGLTDVEAHIRLLILAGVYKSRAEVAITLWDQENGKAMFPSVMSIKSFYATSRLLRFDHTETKAGRKKHDKLAAIRELDHCLFKQYMPDKPANYVIKIWTACDAKSSSVWNVQAKVFIISAFSAEATLVSHCPKKNKNVLLMSTLHQDATVSARQDKKPEMDFTYNATKGGVDNLDKAYLIWSEVNETWKEGIWYKGCLFLEEFGKASIENQVQQ